MDPSFAYFQFTQTYCAKFHSLAKLLYWKTLSVLYHCNCYNTLAKNTYCHIARYYNLLRILLHILFTGHRGTIVIVVNVHNPAIRRTHSTSKK